MQTLKEEATEWRRLGLEDAGKSFKPLNLTVEQKIRHKKLLDQDWSDDSCIFCNRVIEEVGGEMMVVNIVNSLGIPTLRIPDQIGIFYYILFKNNGKSIVMIGYVGLFYALIFH